jgi:hypothetical protein
MEINSGNYAVAVFEGQIGIVFGACAFHPSLARIEGRHVMIVHMILRPLEEQLTEA